MRSDCVSSGGDAQHGGDLLDRRLAALLDRQFAAHPLDGRQRADLMTGHANGAGVIGQGAGDALTNPPGRIGAELVAQAMLVLVHRPHQAAIAFLDQIGEGQAAAAIALGDRHHQTQVALGQFAAGLLILDAAMLQNADQLDAGRPEEERTSRVRSRSCLAALVRRSRSAGERSPASFSRSSWTICRDRLAQLIGPAIEQIDARRQLLGERHGLAEPPPQIPANAVCLAKSRTRSRRKSASAASMSLCSVLKLCGMRCKMCSRLSPSVVTTSMVGSRAS